jgi:hypothetical protein
MARRTRCIRLVLLGSALVMTSVFIAQPTFLDIQRAVDGELMWTA